jgi:hypothetical protein
MMLNKLNPDQKAVGLIETHQMDGAAKIAKANIERYVMGTEPWDYWNKVLTQIDIRRYEKRTATRSRVPSLVAGLAFACGFDWDLYLQVIT